MKAKLGILALLCLLASGCVVIRSWDVTTKPVLYEQYVVYGEYHDVLASIDAKVEQCMRPIPLKSSSLRPEQGMASMYFFCDTRIDGICPYLVLDLQQLDEERTRIEVYANDLSKLAWPHLRRSIQYGAEGKDGCPSSPEADLSH